MSNEDLAIAVKAGDLDKLLELWDGVRRFVHDRAFHWARAVGAANGVTTEDLMQTGFLAMLAAVERFDPNRGNFMTALGFELKTAFSQAVGLRTARDRRDPLRAALSLDAPAGEDEEDGSFVDFVEDQSAAQALEAVEDRERCEAVEAALQQLTEVQKEVIRCRYYLDFDAAQTARKLDLDRGTVRRLEAAALRKLRHPSISRKLAEYL